jgi:hypothetical protein
VDVCLAPLIDLKQWIDFHTATLIDARKEVDLEVYTDKTKYMLLSWLKNAGKSHDLKIGNISSESVGTDYNKSKPDSVGN